MPNHADFDAAIATAVRTAVPDAGADLIETVTAGVVADPVWAALTWLDSKTAEGALAQGLAEKAATLAKAVNAATTGVSKAPESTNANDAASVAAAFGMTMQEWRSAPPETKSRLAAGLAAKQAEQQHQAAGLEALKNKIDSGHASPAQKLEYARLTEEPAPTKQERRSPRFIEAQQSRASLSELRKLKYAHDVEAASGARPPTHRQMHRQHAERIGKIINEREAAGET